jgi:integrase
MVPLVVGMETFGAFLLAQGLAEKTACLYAKRVDDAILWFAERGADLVSSGPADLFAWSQTLSPSTSTRRQARSALRYYFEWLEKPEPGLKAIRVPPKPRYICQAVTEFQASALVAAAISSGRPRGTVVLVGLYLALRVSEIASMRWDRFDREMEHYTVTGKGDYTVTLPVHPKLKEHLEGMETPYPYLFPGERGRAHVNPATVWGWVRDIGEVVGIKGLRPHQLRHTAGATMNDRTGDLRATSEFLRHRRIETSMLYTRTTQTALERAMNALEY